METDVLRAIEGIQIFPIISLVTFVAFFSVMLVWTLRLDRGRMTTLARMPLDEAAPHAADIASPERREGATRGERMGVGPHSPWKNDGALR